MFCEIVDSSVDTINDTKESLDTRTKNTKTNLGKKENDTIKKYARCNRF